MRSTPWSGNAHSAPLRRHPLDCAQRCNWYLLPPEPFPLVPAVHTGLIEDVYLSIAGGGTDAIVLDVFVFPFMWLLWVGGAVVVAGGFLSVIGRRRLQGDQVRARVVAALTVDE